MKVTCTDFYGNDHIVDAAQLIDRLSVYGVYMVGDTVLLIQDPRSIRWELPGGGVEKGETPEQCFIREFEEETGVTPSGKLTFLKEWEEYFFDVVDQQAWRSKRTFYRVERITHQEEMLTTGNGEDSVAASLVPLSQLDALHINSNIRNLIQEAHDGRDTSMREALYT
jgi:8-oxo-dGTP pyrophosphatase MutT (NUDIX family)